MTKLYYGIVIDNDSQNKNGSPKDSQIKVRVIPELKDVAVSDLPWVKPFIGTGMGASLFEHNPPEINDNVWIYFTDEYWREGFYIPGRYIEGIFDYTKWNDSNISDKSASTYPNPRFWIMPDNSILFADYDTGDKGVLNSNGSYTLIKGNGEIYVYSKNLKIKMYNDSGSIELGSDGILDISGDTEFLVKYDTLKSLIDSFITALNLHTHPTAATGPPSPPTVPLSLDITLSKASKIKTT